MHMLLNQILEESKNEFIASTPVAVHSEMFRMIKEQQESGMVYGLQVGDGALSVICNCGRIKIYYRRLKLLAAN